MLPTEHRLRRREDFATAVRRGRRAGRPLLVVHLRTSGATDPHEP
ncbi:ribonuclease P protein component, partial [Amycolatopsis magusensis]